MEKPTSSESVVLLKEKYFQILDNLKQKYKERIKDSLSDNGEFSKEFTKVLQKILPNPEILNLTDSLSPYINQMFQARLITTDEAEELLRILQDSEGKDNFETFALLQLLAEINLNNE